MKSLSPPSSRPNRWDRPGQLSSTRRILSAAWRCMNGLVSSSNSEVETAVMGDGIAGAGRRDGDCRGIVRDDRPGQPRQIEPDCRAQPRVRSRS